MSRPLNDGEDSDADGGSSSGAGGAGGSGSGQKRGIRESDPVSAAELKEKILALAVSQPKACSLVARKLLSTREGMRKLAVACEAIGFEYTRQLFDTVSPGKWRAMGEYLRNNLAEISRTPEGPILLEIYTDMLAESMGWDPSQNVDGPFDFLHKISEPELIRLFSNEDPAHIAFIAAYWEAEEVTQILSVLPDHRRKETILQIARLKALPREIVQQAALQFASRLKVMRSRNELEVDGSQVVARMLGSVDSATEEELLKFIEREDPAARDRLRSHYFSFDSVATVPREVLLAVFESMEPLLVTQALAGADDVIVQAVLDVMPPKQRAIIEDDVKIASTQGTIAKTDTAIARKQVVMDLRKALKDRGIELAQLIGGGGGHTPDLGHSAPAPSPMSPPTPAYSPPIQESATMVAEIPTAGEAVPSDSGDLGMITLEAAPDDTNKAA
jgi:flagellar motor switch protein FliG